MEKEANQKIDSDKKQEKRSKIKKLVKKSANDVKDLTLDVADIVVRSL